MLVMADNNSEILALLAEALRALTAAARKTCAVSPS